MQESDLDTISRVLIGHTDEYAFLVEKYEQKIRGFCYQLLGDLTLADDAAQEVFLKAYRSLDRFQGGAKFSTWLFRIARNHCVDLLRARKRAAEESFEALVEDGSRLLLERSSAGGGSHHGPQLEARELLRKVLPRLSEEYKTVLLLREWQGFSYEEIAGITEASLDSVKARLRRARVQALKELRHFLSEKTVKERAGDSQSIAVKR